jgi:predicted aspartyl protease
VRLAALTLAVLVLAGCGGSAKVVKPTVGADGSMNVAIKVLKHGKQVIALVPVTIDGKGPYNFAIDTGASQSLLDSSVAEKLHVHATGDKHPVAGITDVTQVKTLVVKHWSVGGVQLPTATIVETNLPFGNADGGVQGLLGSDMLSQFDVITIDYDRQVLRLHHRVVKSHG